ncbi:serine hydrolase domain-containing protein [Sediminicola luteus]|nr:serine hydrolase domain-containing protein [Sediminicola luteus]
MPGKNMYILILGLLVLTKIDAQNKQTDQITKEQSELIKEQLEAFPEKAQLAVAIIDNGSVNYYGVLRKQDEVQVVVNRDSVFEIGSITKVFTATLLADFVVNGKVDLDDTINGYLGFTLKDDVQITFKQLATHTSGLPRLPKSLSSPTLDLTNPYKTFDRERLKEDLSVHLKMSSTPGTKSEYSNLGVGLLGFVLGEMEGASYGELVTGKIFDRFQMTHTTTNRSTVKDKLVKGLNDDGEEVSQWDLAILMGAGGVVSTTADLAKFALAQFDEANASLALTRKPHYKATESFSTGLAWGIVKQDADAVWYWHNGGTGGYSASMIIDVENKNGVIVLSNISALGKLTKKVMDLSPELMKTLE